jgi:hypothetical protein
MQLLLKSSLLGCRCCPGSHPPQLVHNRSRKQWWVSAITSGGEGNDSYCISYGSSAYIADASSSSGDPVQIYACTFNITSFFSIKSMHIFVGTSWSTNLIVVDCLNSASPIESMEFMGPSLSGSTDSINSLLAATRPERIRALTI